MDKFYSVTELADEFDITPRAIRFYETKGLLSPQRAGSTRVYTYRDRGRLIIVLRGKRLGFSLSDIKTFLDLYDADTSQLGQMQMLIDKVRQRVATLERQRRDIDVTIGELKDIESQALTALAHNNPKAVRA